MIQQTNESCALFRTAFKNRKLLRFTLWGADILLLFDRLHAMLLSGGSSRPRGVKIVYFSCFVYKYICYFLTYWFNFICSPFLYI